MSIVRRARVTGRSLHCWRCKAPIKLGELYLDRQAGGRNLCEPCAGGNLQHPSERPPLDTVLARTRKEPAPDSVAHLGDGMCWMWTGSVEAAA